MEIKTVKKCGKGYLVNDTQLVLTETEDSMVHVKEWLKTNNAEAEFTEEDLDNQRILSIKNKARELIEIQYPEYKQRNILMSQTVKDIDLMNNYISNIRKISNESESNGTSLEDINWGI